MSNSKLPSEEELNKKYEELSDSTDEWGFNHGWSLLYSPEKTIEEAEFAVLGINPGVGEEDRESRRLTWEGGNAFTDDCWGKNGNHNALQKQIKKLFELLGVEPKNVLSGNIVPFHSISWRNVPPAQRKEALEYGKKIWRPILQSDKLKHIICFGKNTTDAVTCLLPFEFVAEVPVKWGATDTRPGICGDKYRLQYEGREIKLTGLPHLSTYKIIGRPESEAAVQNLLWLD